MNCRLIELAVPLADGSTRKVCPACGRVVDLPGPARGFKAKCGAAVAGDRVVGLAFEVRPPRNPPRRPEAPPTASMPSLPRRALNLAKALATFAADGCRTVDSVEYERRLQICDACPQRDGNWCRVCGCGLAAKAAGRSFECPLGKWARPPPDTGPARTDGA